MPRFNLDNYVDVDTRISRYWEMHPKPEGSIQTEVIWVADDGNAVAIKATVYLGERILATGIAHEERGKSASAGANFTSWWENAETSAIGRALANMDMSLSKNRPSRQEMQKAQRYAEQPPTRAQVPQEPRQAPPTRIVLTEAQERTMAEALDMAQATPKSPYGEVRERVMALHATANKAEWRAIVDRMQTIQRMYYPEATPQEA